MTTYRYLFADLLTNQVIGELPLTGVNFTQQLNTIGTFTGRLLLSGVNSAALNVANSTIPAKTAVYVDRDGVLVWGGVLWGRPYKSDSQTLEFQAQEFESYFNKRRVTVTQAFTATDQFTIAQWLINTAQTATGGNIGVVVPTNTSGVNVSRTYYSYERKNVYQALLDLSRAENGFDFNIQVAYDTNYNPQKTLVLSYPRSGTAYSVSNPTAPVFEFPAGNMVLYELEENGSLSANTVYAMGAGSNEGKLIATGQETTYLSAGWPLLEEVANYSDYTDTTLLQQLADAQSLATAYPPTTFKIVYPPAQNPVFGTYNLGDDCRLRILDDRFPTGLDAAYRIVAINVQPGEDGPERATLTLTQATV